MNRYERQIMLPQIGLEGQERLRGSCIAIVGLGALGSVSADILVRSGVGKVILIDYDIVQLSNLQRQSLYTQEDVGMAKVHAALKHLQKINSDVSVVGFLKQLNVTTVDLLDEVDLVLDCTDNMYSRFLLNEYCKKERKPWIYCGAIETHGAVAFFDEGVCFNCIFGDRQASQGCDDVGILASASHIAAALQCTIALRYLILEKIESELLQFDVWPFSIQQVQMKKKESCSVCSGSYNHLEGEEFVDFCLTKRCVKVRPSKEKATNIPTHEVREFDGTKGFEIDGVDVLVHNAGAMEINTTNLDLAKKIAQKIWKKNM